MQKHMNKGNTTAPFRVLKCKTVSWTIVCQILVLDINTFNTTTLLGEASIKPSFFLCQISFMPLIYIIMCRSSQNILPSNLRSFLNFYVKSLEPYSTNSLEDNKKHHMDC